MEPSASVILVAGPPGAGKEHVSKQLAEALDRPVAYIKGDAFWKFFVKGTPAPTTPARSRDRS